MEAIGKFFVVLVILIISVLISGFILMKTWGWFIVPIFTSLPILKFGEAIGIAFFIAILKGRQKSENNDFDDLIESFFNGLIYSLVLFLFAWVVYLFISF